MNLPPVPTQVSEEMLRDPQFGISHLKRISIFEGLKDEELAELFSLGNIRTLKSQAHAVIEGENSRGLFILLSGTVSVYKNERMTNAMIRLAMLEKGAAFGELSLFDTAPRSATVTAEVPCQLFFLDVFVFERFLDQKGDNLKARFFKKCALDMAARFRTQNQDYITSQQLLWKYALRKEEE